MAFELATIEEIAKPVTCVSVASPMVGNVDFLNAFQVSNLARLNFALTGMNYH